MYVVIIMSWRKVVSTWYDISQVYMLVLNSVHLHLEFTCIHGAILNFCSFSFVERMCDTLTTPLQQRAHRLENNLIHIHKDVINSHLSLCFAVFIFAEASLSAKLAKIMKICTSWKFFCYMVTSLTSPCQKKLIWIVMEGCTLTLTSQPAYC